MHAARKRSCRAEEALRAHCEKVERDRVLARLCLRIRGVAAGQADDLVTLAATAGRNGRRTALGFVTAWLFGVLGFAALGSASANSAATIELSPAQPGEVILVSAAPEQIEAPAPIEEVLAAVTAEPTPPTAPPRAQAVAPPVARQAAAASAETAAPPPAPVGKQYTSDEVRGFARQAGWPDSLLDDVVAVAACESGLNSGAMGGPALGLMQVVGFWFEKAGVDRAQWTDPVANLKVAHYVYTHGISSGYAPWAAWGCEPPRAAPAASPAAAAPSPDAKTTAVPTAPAEQH